MLVDALQKSRINITPLSFYLFSNYLLFFKIYPVALVRQQAAAMFAAHHILLFLLYIFSMKCGMLVA
jgi:hypothetical protein